MPVAVIHLDERLTPEACEALGEATREAVVGTLGLPPEFGKAIIYTAPEGQRSAHPSRDVGFALVEVHLFAGRPRELKARLVAALDAVIREHTGLSPENVFVHLIESPRENWGLRGGQQADEVELP